MEANKPMSRATSIPNAINKTGSDSRPTGGTDEGSSPMLPSSPVSATIQITPDEDDTGSCKSLTIVRSSFDEPSDTTSLPCSVSTDMDTPPLASSPSKHSGSQISPVSAVISLAGDPKHLALPDTPLNGDSKHQVPPVIPAVDGDGKHLVEPVIEEEESDTVHDEDTIMPLPSEVTSGDAVDGQRAPVSLPFNEYREPFQLPWGARRAQSNSATGEDKPGAFVLKKLFTDFTYLASRKIEQVLAESLEKPLQKSLQRGEDSQLDQLLSTLNAVAEHCLPSLLKTLFAWHDRQIPHKNHKSKMKGSRDVLSERRDLAVEFLFCLVLIEVLKQLNYHPGYDDLIEKILQMSFSQIKVNITAANDPNAPNINTLADLYAEVLGELAKSRFLAVKKRFLLEMKELSSKEPNSTNQIKIISLIMGLKFFRVKMHPIEEFEACVQFLHDLGSIFVDTKDRDIKHALAGLFVEIMLPMAAIVQTEVNVPVLRNFVEKIYPVAHELSNKKRNSLALFPMVTVLLCVSQKNFFKTHWPTFLTSCISNLRSRESKMSRVALESLYRLVWVYMIRVKCESNAATTQKLTLITSALFPKGQKGVTPRDTPLNIYVKMLQFIAREKLDFAMREVIFDLLSITGKKAIVTILPERMSIGLRAFLVISDDLQQKEGEPPMPQTVGVMPSGSTIRVKKTFLNKILTDESARNIGVQAYYPQVRKAFSSILKLLDSQIGKSLMMTKPENRDKDLEDLINVEKKPKLDLLRTCVAAVPRLMPSSDLSISELVEMLIRYTVHIDEELRVLAYKSVESILNNFSETRDVILSSFVCFVQHEIPDVQPQLIDNALRMLQSLMSHWRTTTHNQTTASRGSGLKVIPGRTESIHAQRQAVHQVEGLALVMLCSCRVSSRKLAVGLLKESHNLLKEICPQETCVITAVDEALPKIMESMLPFLPALEKNQVQMAASNTIDLQWLVDQSSKVWFSGYSDESLSRSASHNSTLAPFDAWVEVLSGILNYDLVKANFPVSASNAWPIVFSRLSTLFPLIDPNNTANDQRSSGLLRATKKLTNERDVYINLWHNYIVFACCIAPSGIVVAGHDSSAVADGSQPDSRPSSSVSLSSETGRDLFRLLVPLMKCEISELRDSCITAMSRCSPEALHELSEELVPTIKDAIDRKQENVRRRKKKDTLRLYVSKLFHLLASNKIFTHRCSNVIDTKRHTLKSVYIEFIDGARQVLESEAERDFPILQEVRVHFSSFMTHLIKHCPVEHKDRLMTTELRYTLFNLLSSWSQSLGYMYAANNAMSWPYRPEVFTELELVAVEAMSAVLGCGKIFDPTGISQKDGYIYPWLDRLLSCSHSKVNKIGQDTCEGLLRYNADTQYLLDWTIDRCFRGSVQVADGCFTTLVRIFTSREYPCDSVAMLNLALLYCGCPRIHIREMSSQLLLTLSKRFLLIDNELLTNTSAQLQQQIRQSRSLEDVLITAHSQTQLYLSEHLSTLNPELTIQIFSEVCQRIDTAVPSIRHNMLSYLSPWLLNVELVNPQIPASSFLPPTSGSDTLPFTDKSSSTQLSRSLLTGSGWGSLQASEMVLTNLMYLSVRYGDEHAEAIELLWQDLSSSFPSNLKYIIKFLLILSGVSPTSLLSYTKRVFVYLARKHPRLVVDELMVELQSVETLPFSVERCDAPPYFRMNSYKSCRPVPTADPQSSAEAQSMAQSAVSLALHDSELTLTAEEGVVFAKKLSEIKPLHGRSDSADSDATADTKLTQADVETDTKTKSQPYPLPMPAYGGYYAPLQFYMPSEGPLLVNTIQRCFLSLCAISDLFTDNQSINWTMHMPTLLQVTTLGCDHGKSIVYEHCKKSLLSLLLSVLDKTDQVLSHILEAITNLHSSIYGSIFKSTVRSANLSNSAASAAPSSLKGLRSAVSMTSICTLTPDGADHSPSSPTAAGGASSNLVRDSVQFVIDLIKGRENKPLWSYETVTPRQKELKSLSVMASLLTHLVKIFKLSLPHSLIDLRWCQASLQFAMNCPSRHYAGRSLQIFRLLGLPMNTQMLSDIISRLVEVVCENGEEMQGFVTEILQTIEKSVVTLDLGVIGTDSNNKDLFISTPNLKSSERVPSVSMLGMKKSTTGIINLGPSRSHKRSTSVSLSAVTKKAGNIRPSSPGKIHPLTDLNSDSKCEIGNEDSYITEDVRMNMDEKLSTLVQMFWLGASLLESDYEHEFLLAVNLLKQMLNYLKPDRIECKDKMEKVLQQLQWPKFPGLHSLVVKGLTSTQTCNDTWTLLSQLTLCVRAPVISQSDTLGFPVNVMCLLPYMVQHYEEPTSTCLEAADNIVQMSLEISSKLENLATVMKLYSRGTFGKDAHQWTKCVVKYLTDIYHTEHLHIITLLLEILEQGSPSSQAAILLILHCILHYVDINSLPSATMSSDLISTVSKFVEGPHWNEAQKILKLAVKSSSSLIPATNGHFHSPGTQAIKGLASLYSHTSFAEAEILVKKDLPGRTLDFSFDVTSTPVICERYLHPANERNSQSKSGEGKRGGALSSPSVSSADSAGNWRRPHHSQTRVRERLLYLLSTLGQRVGVIKSPSVIFSQVSEPLDKQTSICSSSEETSSVTDQGDRAQEDSSVSDQFGDQYFKDFDFLDNETEHIDDEDEDKFNWGVKRQHSINELDLADSNSHQDVLRRINQRRRETEAESSARSTDDEGPDELENGGTSLFEERIDFPATEKEDVDEGTKAREMKGSEQTESVPSNCSDTELSLPATVPDVHPGPITFLNISGDEVEEYWRMNIENLICGESASLSISNMYNLFNRLFQDTQRKLSSLTKEICFYLSKIASLRELSAQFLLTLDSIQSQATCPFTYLDPETESTVCVSDQHKFALLEVYESYVTYIERREATQGCLGNIKSSIKLVSLGTHVSEAFTNMQRNELCSSLYRLQFQLVALYSDHMKLLHSLLSVCEQEEVSNISEEVISLASALQSASDSIEVGALRPSNMDVSGISQAKLQQMILDSMTTEKNYINCIWYVRTARESSSVTVFGDSSANDIPACLSIYCRRVSEDKRNGLLAVTSAPDILPQLNRQLLSLKLQLNSVQLAHSSKSDCISSSLVSGGNNEVKATGSNVPSSVTNESLHEKVESSCSQFIPIDISHSDSKDGPSPSSRDESDSKGTIDSPAVSLGEDEAIQDSPLTSSAL